MCGGFEGCPNCPADLVDLYRLSDTSTPPNLSPEPACVYTYRNECVQI